MVKIIKEVVNELRKGASFGLGVILIFGIIFGVYAFVEPSQSPTVVNNYVDSNSPIIGKSVFDTCRVVENYIAMPSVWDEATCHLDEQFISGGCAFSVIDSSIPLTETVNQPSSSGNGWGCYQNNAGVTRIRTVCCK